MCDGVNTHTEIIELEVKQIQCITLNCRESWDVQMSEIIFYSIYSVARLFRGME